MSWETRFVRRRGVPLAIAAVMSLATLAGCGGGGSSSSSSSSSGGSGVQTPSADTVPAPGLPKPEGDLAALPIEVRATKPDEYITTLSGARIVRGELLVTLRDEATHEAFKARLTAANLSAVGRIPEARIYQVRSGALTEQDLTTAKAQVLTWPEVLRATENSASTPFAADALVPNDPGYKDSAWAFNLIGAPDAWQQVANSGVAGTRIRVGVIDVGFQSIPGELEFAALYMSDGSIAEGAVPPAEAITASPVTAPATFADETKHFHHGMHVAGLVAAKANNAISTVGVAWQAPMDLIGAQHGSMMENLANLARMLRGGVKVVNLSFGTTDPKLARDGALTWGHLVQALSFKNEFLIVAAAGNQPSSTFDQSLFGALFDPTLDDYIKYAVARSRVLVVGALDGDGKYADYSATGVAVQIVAPGGGWGCGLPTGVPTADRPYVYPQNATATDDATCTTTTSLRGIKSLRYGGGSIFDSGTSMASPIVAGAAALTWSQFPALSAIRLKDALITAGASDRVTDPTGRSVPKLRLDLALKAASDASRSPTWDAATWQPAPARSAVIIGSVVCKFGAEERSVPGLPVEIYPLGFDSANLANRPSETDASGFHISTLPLDVVGHYGTSTFFFYVPPQEGRNRVINKAFTLPATWPGPVIRSIEVVIQAKSAQGCTGGADFESMRFTLFGLESATPVAQPLSEMRFLEQGGWQLDLRLRSSARPGTVGSFHFGASNCGGTLVPSGRLTATGEHVFQESHEYGHCVRDCELRVAADLSGYREVCRPAPFNGAPSHSASFQAHPYSPADVQPLLERTVGITPWGLRDIWVGSEWLGTQISGADFKEGLSSFGSKSWGVGLRLGLTDYDGTRVSFTLDAPCKTLAIDFYTQDGPLGAASAYGMRFTGVTMEGPQPAGFPSDPVTLRAGSYMLALRRLSAATMGWTLFDTISGDLLSSGRVASAGKPAAYASGEINVSGWQAGCFIRQVRVSDFNDATWF